MNADSEKYAKVIDEATQDGRRLAMLYESYPEEFRKVYEGVKKFSKLNL